MKLGYLIVIEYKLHCIDFYFLYLCNLSLIVLLVKDFRCASDNVLNYGSFLQAIDAKEKFVSLSCGFLNCSSRALSTSVFGICATKQQNA